MTQRVASVDDEGRFYGLVAEQLAETVLDTSGTAQGVVYPEGAALGALTYASLQAACTLAASTGKRAWAAGSITTSSTLTVECDCDLTGVTINYTGSGTAVIAGKPSGYVMHKDMRLPRVIAANKVLDGGWAAVAGTIGVDLCNLYSVEVSVPLVQDFETGLREYGMNGNGISYVTVKVGHLYNNKVNQKLDADSTGWANQILHLGGRWSHNSGEGSNVAGTKHILIQNITGHADPNNNLWCNPSLESPGVVEYAIDAQAGSYNVWMNPRLEFSTGASKVRWGSGAVRNTIFGGNQADSIVETFITGQASNSVFGTGRFRLNGQGASGALILENEGGVSQPALTVMRVGGTGLGDSPATAYVQRMESALLKQKRYSDANERVRVDGNLGQVLLGDGTAAPAAGILGTGAFLLITAGATTVGPATDGGASLGAAANYRFDYVRAKTALRTGTFATASRPTASAAGAGAMIFDTTLNKPVWSDGAAWRDATGAVV